MRGAEGQLVQDARVAARRPPPSASGHSRPPRCRSNQASRAEVEAARLRRRRRRREPRLPEEPQPRRKHVGGRRRVERDAHPRRRPRRLEPVDHHPVEQHPRPVARRAVEPDDPPLDVRRHLVGQHRRRHRSRVRSAAARSRAPAGAPPGCRRAPTVPTRQSVGDADASDPPRAPPASSPRLRRQREIERDAERRRSTGIQSARLRALRLDQRGEAGGAHVPCSPARFRPKTTLPPAWLPGG